MECAQKANDLAGAHEAEGKREEEIRGLLLRLLRLIAADVAAQLMQRTDDVSPENKKSGRID
jgi:hypothetical protein